MDGRVERVNGFAAALREQLRERPYWTTAALVGVGWLLGRALPVRAVIAVAGIGARAAMATALEDIVRDRVRGPGEGQEAGAGM